MHILFLSDNFPPEVNAPASRTFEHCREWVKLGHSVTVITCFPNFPSGRVYNGYRNGLHETEVTEGVTVKRVWTYIAPNKGFVRRILDYLSYMFASAIASPGVKGVDVVIATSPQFFTACSGYIVSRLKRVPFIFELRDMWPESIKAVGAMKDSPLIRLLEKVELFLYRKADLIITVTESFEQNLKQRGIDGAKIEVVLNGVDLEAFHPMEKDSAIIEKFSPQGKTVAGYIGTHGMAHGLNTLLNAAKFLQEEGSERDFHFLMVGDGAEKDNLKRLAVKYDLKNITFMDQVPKDKINKIWAVMDVSIIHLKKTELFRTVIPSKIFESMGMGVPILLGVEGESAGIIEKEGVGLTFEPDNPLELVNKLKELTDDPALYARLKQNCLRSAKLYDRKDMAAKMLDAMSAVVQKNNNSESSYNV